MQNLHLFSIKNKIDLESNPSLFKSNLFYECSLIVNNKIILFNNKNCFLKFRELKKLDIKKENIYFLGKKNKTVFIGASLSLRKIKTVLKDKTFSLENLRDCINLVNNEHVSYLSALFFLERWKNENKFCSKCGAKNRFNNFKNYIECTNKSCLKRIFPKIDPTVIILIKNNNRILLARSKNWKQNLYSCIAGFCEQNESLEQTVIREAYEEVGLKLKNINYLFSQFWPFANNLMVGFEAISSSAKLKINKSEIEDAIWVTRKELLNLKNKKKIILPKKYAIAHSLIAHWQKS
jgi:NAD+ diphosphatase